MKMKYVDAHCHIQFDQYAGDETDIVNKMSDQGVVGIVVGVDAESSKKALTLAEKYEHLYASVGLHPNHASDETFDKEAFTALAKHPNVVAIGECGLDYFRPTVMNEEVKCAQKELFRKHITLATLLNKPLIIHARPSKGTQDAYQDLIEILKEAKKEYSNLRGDVHFFVGSIAEAEALIALDFTLSFTAVITFARDYDKVIQSVPLSNILSETDAPYVAPSSRRGQRNDPLSVVDVVSQIASIRAEDQQTIQAALLANAQRLFSLP